MPQYPPIVTGVVHRLFLRFDFSRPVLRLADLERLQPCANVFGIADSERAIPLVKFCYRSVDHLVRLRIRPVYSERATRIV